MWRGCLQVRRSRCAIFACPKLALLCDKLLWHYHDTVRDIMCAYTQFVTEFAYSSWRRRPYDAMISWHSSWHNMCINTVRDWMCIQFVTQQTLWRNDIMIQFVTLCVHKYSSWLNVHTVRDWMCIQFVTQRPYDTMISWHSSWHTMCINSDILCA